MNRKFYEIKAAANDSAEVLIYGDIGESWDGSTVAAKQFVEELGNTEARSLDVRVNSYGGSVSDGLAIYNAIKRHPAIVTVSIDGVAASIASLIAMAGDTVTAADNAMIMIHAPWAATIGNANDMREMADVLDRYANSMASGYAAKTSKSTDDVLALLTDGNDHWFDAAEALEFGLIDQVTDALQVAAHFDLSRFNPPEKVKNMATPKKETPEDVKATVLAAEQKRRQEIRDVARPVSHYDGMQRVIDACLDDPTVDLPAARERILAKMAEGSEPLGGGAGHIVYEGDTGATVTPYGGYGSGHFVAAAVDALLLKSGQQVKDPVAGAQDLRHMRLSDIAKAAINAGSSAHVRHRIKDGAAPHEIIQASMTTSDFPVILENLAEKSLLNAYENEPASHRVWVKPGQVPDFKQVSRVAVSTAPSLLQVPEGAEYTNGSLYERGEKFAIVTFGRILHFTRQSMVNDDVAAFTRAIAAFGRSASRLEADLVYSALADNGDMSDGKPLFHADHNNLLTAGALSVDTLALAKKAMRDQKDISGQGYLNVVPRFLIVGTDDELGAEQILNSVYQPANPGDATPAWIRALTLVVEPRVSGGFYLAADHNQAEHIELATLDGAGVHTEEQIDFHTDGYKVKARLDVAAAAVDWAGINYTPAT